MKFTLKDYQEEAVRAVLVNLSKARKRWKEDGDKHAFSLTATTGAGKTVMAAAVFEALFHGDDNYDVERDPGAVVIWFSDDPSLNQQSKFRLLECADRLNYSDLVVVENTFRAERLSAGRIYFLNTQKLSKSSLLVRGHEEGEQWTDKDGQRRMIPDGREHSIWDIIRNTIEDDRLTLYLVLDEAHRGMKASTGGSERQTIVRRLINGSGSVPGIPVVLGISATVERFDKAMDGMQGRSTLPNVVVDPAKVQESGLLKDTIVLDIPKVTGPFDTVLVRRGADKLKEITAAWDAYAREQNLGGSRVSPLMVLQVPNTPDPDDIGKALDTIFQQWPDLHEDCVANVFGDHKTERFGRHSVPYLSPERVQETGWVRILVAKDAISTGWDCPRAEVLVSFRPAQDKTHITQVMGRMLRTPLARRVPGNERLNSVDCLLPFFDEASVKEVVDALTTGGEAGAALPGRRVLINPVELKPNPAVPTKVWEKLVSLPSQTLPKKHAKPVKRLTSLAHYLACDGLLPDAGKLAHAKMHKVLDAAQVLYEKEIAAARHSVLTVEGKSLKKNLRGGEMTFENFVEDADYAVIEDAYKRAGRTISPDLARTYAEYLADEHEDAIEDYEGALIESHTTIAALGLVAKVGEMLENEAEKLANAWHDQYRIAIRNLSDERQAIYRENRELSTKPMEVDLAHPKTWMQPTTIREAGGGEKPLPRFELHLMCDEEGKFPESLTGWEADVVKAELAREGAIAWYRNPSRACGESLGILYGADDEPKIVRPDFIFFFEQPNGSIVADIVDPHGTHFSDSIPKLKGLAKYAENFGSHYRRIDGVAKIGDQFRVLDLQEPSVRAAVQAARDIKELYESNVGADYLI